MPTVIAGLELAKSRDMTCILNPAPYSPIPAKALAATDIITPNQGEAAALTGIDSKSSSDLGQGLKSLFNQGPQSTIVTLGQAGVMLVNEEGEHRIASFAVQSVDSVGAGDAFNGVLAAALARRCSLDSAIRLACAAGALATTKRGAQESMPGKSEVEALAGLQFDQRA
jgi:ribokinase